MNAPTDLATIAAALAEHDAGAAARHDGWTPERRQTFLAALSEGHTVEAACRVVGLSVASAYALRRRAGGEAFALGWRAANLLARDRLVDILTSRAIDGQVDTYTRADGHSVTRHRFDNRLATALLTRLDRLAESAPFASVRTGNSTAMIDEEDAARAAAADFAALLDIVAEEECDAETVRDFVKRSIVSRNPQLPQLRDEYDDDEEGDDGEDGDEEDAAPDADLDIPPVPRDVMIEAFDRHRNFRSSIWWDHRINRLCTDRLPPNGYVGRETNSYGHPDYSRDCTPREVADFERETEAKIAADPDADGYY